MKKYGTNSAYDCGCRAAEAGEPASSNPHSMINDPVEHQNWADGWQATRDGDEV